MRMHTILLGAAVMAAAACSRTDDGKLVVKTPSDVSVKTKQDTLSMPSVGTKTDTVNSPVVGTQKETLIVNKPVVGTEKKVVKVPTVKRP